MKTTHWIIYRNTNDPPGIEFVNICHSAEEAKQALTDSAQYEADRANQKRADDFKKGYQSGRRLNADDFKHDYITAKVTTTS